LLKTFFNAFSLLKRTVEFMVYNILAQQISDNINMDSFQSVYKAELINSNHFELFYEVDAYRYVSVFKYGVICFLNFDNEQVNEFI